LIVTFVATESWMAQLVTTTSLVYVHMCYNVYLLLGTLSLVQLLGVFFARTCDLLRLYCCIAANLLTAMRSWCGLLWLLRQCMMYLGGLLLGEDGSARAHFVLRRNSGRHACLNDHNRNAVQQAVAG
jgi:hypothetical protein